VGDGLGDFKEWDWFVRRPLLWLGRADPVETMKEVRNNAPDKQAVAELLAAMAELFLGNDNGRFVSFIVDAADPESIIKELTFAGADVKRKALPDALMKVAATGKTLSSSRLGTWFRSNNGKLVGGFRLCAEMDKHAKQNRWFVEKDDGRGL
jgi:hypothetical protein